MRILITGGAGFIGSNITDAYLAAGYDVAVVDDLSSGSADNVDPRARWYRVDIRDAALDAVFAEERPEVVCHHAAQVSVRRSVESPQTDADVNVLGSLNVFETARRHGTRRIVFASTGGAIYGEQTGPPADETHPCRPRSPYAVAKLAIEHYLDYFRVTFGLEAVVLRYANVYGPRQDPHGEAGVVAIFMQRILAGLAPTIFGDGEQVRDFVYVEDVVAANLAALRVAVAAEDMAIFNIGTGRATSVNALWRVIQPLARPRVGAYHEPVRSGDVRRSVLDPSRAAGQLGWRPAVGIEEGLARTWAWFVAQADRKAAETA
ncbi:MAG TPA: NAD-dependent epimerase/dehydratase family protein [Patescibacteria group bacterium]|nr:NAD-dependent epimerase/dehydratase family protein [Patescibacteria group bacterium]